MEGKSHTKKKKIIDNRELKRGQRCQGGGTLKTTRSQDANPQRQENRICTDLVWKKNKLAREERQESRIMKK